MIRVLKMSLFGMISLLLAVTSLQAGTLAPGLEEGMRFLQDDEVLKVLVVMQSDHNPILMDKNLHDEGISLSKRHRTVIRALRQNATVVQTGLLADLETRMANKNLGGVRGYTPHWIVNGVVVVAEVRVIREIAAREDVLVVEPDMVAETIEPVLRKQAGDAGKVGTSTGFVTTGVHMVNAPRVWNQLGFRGEGTLVANLDSGVDGAHPALAARWRGLTAPAEECWRDDADLGFPDFPGDYNGHGTHTMGTITGATANDTIGVAPAALWIASNAVSNDSQNFDNTIIAAFEFFADPDGNPETMNDVPDVVHNSWGLAPNPQFGIFPCDSRYWDAIDNCEAAGVVVTWSAGNEGPGPGTLRTPPDRATSPTNSFSIGSVGNSSNYTVSSFSSRGPSGCGGEFQIKPEVVAPGEDVISSLPGGNYGYMSGTSMAGPHVAGIVALMRQANPDLDVISIKEIIMETAIDFGPVGEDNDSGWGMVNAYEAVLASLVDLATVEGTVTDQTTGLPLAGVTVTRTGGYGSLLTEQNGFYSLTMRAGSDDFTFNKFGYEEILIPVQVESGQALVLDVSLPELPQAKLSGTVTGPDGQVVDGAVIRALEVDLEAVITNHEGYYELWLPAHPEAHFQIMASAQDLAYAISFVGLPDDRVLDFQLPHIIAEGFESGSFVSFPWRTGGDEPMAIDFSEAQEGYFSAASGPVNDREDSVMELDYFVIGSGDLSFHLMTDCELHYDYLAFFIDGNFVQGWSGQTPWTQFQTPLSRGQHTLTWAYYKDSSVSAGRDQVWIDRIEFPGTGVEPLPQLDIDLTPVATQIGSGMTDEAIIQVGNLGGYRLDFTTRVLDNPEWVSVSPAESWAHPGTLRDVNILFDATGLDDGTYQGLLELQTNDANNPLVTLPLIMLVGAVSQVEVQAPAPRVELIGAVPNPFNPQTHVAYSLPEETHVTLGVYDLSGRLVRELVSGLRPAGRNQERWDGRDDSGREVASGVYFARLTAQNQLEMKAMLLLR